MNVVMMILVRPSDHVELIRSEVHDSAVDALNTFWDWAEQINGNETLDPAQEASAMLTHQFGPAPSLIKGEGDYYVLFSCVLYPGVIRLEWLPTDFIRT